MRIGYTVTSVPRIGPEAHELSDSAERQGKKKDANKKKKKAHIPYIIIICKWPTDDDVRCYPNV